MAKIVRKVLIKKAAAKRVGVTKKAVAKKTVVKKAMIKGMGSMLQTERYEELFSGFKYWHISDFIKQINKKHNKGGILPFVRGLRLSAQLIYAIREILESENLNLEANWGHILDDD